VLCAGYVSSSQTLAAFGAACVDDSAATTGCHTGTETMGTLATHDGRLVGTFHVGLAYLINNRQKYFGISAEFLFFCACLFI
jgi:hypothetical protein